MVSSWFTVEFLTAPWCICTALSLAALWKHCLFHCTLILFQIYFSIHRVLSSHAPPTGCPASPPTLRHTTSSTQSQEGTSPHCVRPPGTHTRGKTAAGRKLRGRILYMLRVLATELMNWQLLQIYNAFSIQCMEYFLKHCVLYHGHIWIPVWARAIEVCMMT